MAMGQSHWSGIGLFGSVPVALLPWLLTSRIAPMYEAAGAPLPKLVSLWLHLLPLSLLLPVLVGVVWWRLGTHPRRGTVTALVSGMGGALVNALSVMALWLAVLRLPELAS